jgi:CubicO group peptidase (beta-lactamase class C family)
MKLALASLALLHFASTPCAQQAPDLTAQIEAIRAEAGLPALGGALVTVDGLQGVWVTGTRRAGGTEKVTVDDQWHLGSCTKSMTATLLALLVKRGDLKWETPLGEIFPEFEADMNIDLLDVTLDELLCHRAGLPSNPSDLRSEQYKSLDLIGQREALTRSVLTHAPVHAPRGEFLYSNTGVLIAGHVAEVATKKPWETLMRELLFEPLGMSSAGFGPPGTSTVCDQPRGHSAMGKPLEPGPEADNPPVIGPAGTVHASLADWAKYIQLHLKGARGDVKVGELTLTREAFTHLHTPYVGPGQGYGYGWVFEKRPWAGGDGTAFWHNGSNTMWYCVAWLGPANGVAALVTTNIAGPKATAAADQVAGLLLKEYERRKAASPGR